MDAFPSITLFRRIRWTFILLIPPSSSLYRNFVHPNHLTRGSKMDKIDKPKQLYYKNFQMQVCAQKIGNTNGATSQKIARSSP